MSKEENNENIMNDEKPITLNALRERLQEKREKHDKDDGDHEFRGFDKEPDNDGDDVKKPKKPKKEKEDVSEETLAGSSLHPAAKSISDPKAISTSKVEMMKNMVNHMAGMKKGDLTKWFEDSMKIYGPGKDHGVGNSSERNVNSINSHLGKGPHTKDPMPKIHVREDLDEIFVGIELSEEFKEKTAVLFEAAVHARVILETAKLEEEFVDIFTEEVEYFTETLTNKLDMYLDYTVDNWMSENKIAVESSLRNELSSDFIEGLKSLFVEHYIDIPDEKIDVVNVLADKVTDLENVNEDLISENAVLKDALVNEAKQDVFEEVSQGLTVSQVERFEKLIESVDFDGDFDSYEKKLNIIKDSHFNEKSKVVKSNILDESFEGEEVSTTSHSIDPYINKYADAITRTVKKFS
jgi:hypothetical protein